MFNIGTFINDPYNRKARLQPALLALLPALLIALLLIPEFKTVWAAPVGLIIYCGGGMWLTQIARDRGKILEPTLFAIWDGKPSVGMLRQHDTRIATTIKNRYRTFLEKQVPDLKLASLSEEQNSRVQADDGYESATAWLLTQTRDSKRFRLVFEENVNYGFRRNLWALKPLALLFDGLIIAIFLGFIVYSWVDETQTTFHTINNLLWFGAAITLLHMIIFIFFVKPSWVRIPAEAYALQLLAACDVLSDK